MLYVIWPNFLEKVVDKTPKNEFPDAMIINRNVEIIIGTIALPLLKYKTDKNKRNKAIKVNFVCFNILQFILFKSNALKMPPRNGMNFFKDD
jgi:hypothetical protein